MKYNMIPARVIRPWIEPPASTRIYFRYRPPGRHARLFDVQIVLDSYGIASRIEIRCAVATTDDLPPLTCGTLSAARLRTAADLLGLIERMISASRITYAPGALVSMFHLKRVDRAQPGNRSLKPRIAPTIRPPHSRVRHQSPKLPDAHRR
ncbi:hypothetical protein [Paraburkholderia sacchari]|uniref:hypothetical protein n=1 Tax=Paraburkholderia sacchari TaxID=159450 RepID=UPI001BCEB145|nr:hypothetical protein [Paraburkholderia sacchari]